VDMFTATVQRNLSYLVIGGVLLMVLVSGTGFLAIPDAILQKLFDAAFLIVLLFWFQRQRPEGNPASPHAPLTPPSAITAPAPSPTKTQEETHE